MGPGCDDPHGGGDPEPTAAFSVDVDLNGDGTDDVSVVVTEVKINGNRQSLNGTMASPNLDLLDTSDLDCTITLGSPTLAQFSISTAKIPPSSRSLTYVEANIYDFTATTPTGAARFTLSFVPNTPLTFNDRLFPPTDSVPNVLAGSEIGVSISPDHGPCSGAITQDWTITVSKD